MEEIIELSPTKYYPSNYMYCNVQPIGRYVRLVNGRKDKKWSAYEVQVYGDEAKEVDTDGDGQVREDCNYGMQSKCRCLVYGVDGDGCHGQHVNQNIVHQSR